MNIRDFTRVVVYHYFSVWTLETEGFEVGMIVYEILHPEWRYLKWSVEGLKYSYMSPMVATLWELQASTQLHVFLSLHCHDTQVETLQLLLLIVHARYVSLYGENAMKVKMLLKCYLNAGY